MYLVSFRMGFTWRLITVNKEPVICDSLKQVKEAVDKVKKNNNLIFTTGKKDVRIYKLMDQSEWEGEIDL